MEWRPNRFNISFRFGDLQADKLRACDDLKHSMANLACSVHTPMQLVSWDHLEQLSRTLTSNGGDWYLFKEDREAAYKQLPLDVNDQRHTILALRHPPTGRWFGFVARTLIFGSIDAVLRYNVFSRLIASLDNRCLGLPLVAYFDDFAAIIRACLGEDSLRVFTEFCPPPRYTAQAGKVTDRKRGGFPRATWHLSISCKRPCFVSIAS